MTSTGARARDTPGRAPIPQKLDGLLVIDLKKRRARYECYRPGCPQHREEPVRQSAITAFIDGIKARHLTQYHGEQR